MALNSPICITGMHRSGTSAIAGIFEQSGVYFGPIVRTPSPYSPKGHRENRLIASLNEDILRVNNGSWKNPVVCDYDPTISLERSVIINGMKVLTDIQARCHMTARWGFKCCRVLFSMDHWLHQIPDLQLIGVYRHPAEVAASLMKRDNMSKGDALELWSKYNNRLLFWHEYLNGFPLINFSSVHLEEHIKNVLEYLRLDNTNIDFYDPALRSVGAFDVPNHINELYEKLNKVASVHTTTPQGA